MKRLYWAYGSNLNKAAMLGRCPAAEAYRPLTLDGQLVFRGVADVIGREGSRVPGALWWITDHCEQELDRYEGVKSGLYSKKYLTLRLKDGSVERCLYYKMNENGIQPPSDIYLATIERGYRDFGLDLAYLDDAVERSWRDRYDTPRLTRRYERRQSRWGGLAQPVTRRAPLWNWEI